MRVGARSKPNPETTGCKREGATRWDCAFFRLHGADVGIRRSLLLCTIQDLHGHSNFKTTQRYCRVSNLKVQRDYFNAMEVIMQQRAGNPDST